MMKKFIISLILILFNFYLLLFKVHAQIIPNGKIDNIDELIKKETVYTYTKDRIRLATDIFIPVFQDSVIADIAIGSTNYAIQIIPKNSQFVIFDTNNINANSYSLPIIYSRTPYDKNSDDMSGKLFSFMGYGYAIQDMRGRYGSEGVYFPMYSDSWQKSPYHPNISIPMDLSNPSTVSNAINHSDGSESIFYLSDSVYRNFDINLDGIPEHFKFCNGNIGMYGASALGNSQYQALSNIPFSITNNPIKCLMSLVATNEHFNTTLFHNGVFRHSLAVGWITGQMTTGIYDTLVGIDKSIYNNLHSPADYGYTQTETLANDLIDWFISTKYSNSFSGAHPSSLLRKDLDASLAPIDALGNSNANGTFSRYKNLNKPIYHLTGWWDIFINGQIETFNNIRKANPNSNQKIVIGPWTHQTIGGNTVGDEIYPENVHDVLGLDLDLENDINNLFTDSVLINQIYHSEILNWYRTHLGGEPYFIIPESQIWQQMGSNEIRIPSRNYIIPYYQFMNFLGGQSALNKFPAEMKTGGVISPIIYNVPALDNPLLHFSSPIKASDPNYFNNIKDVRLYITGPSNDNTNKGVGNYWLATDSIPFENGVKFQKFYLHQNKSIDLTAPVHNEGSITYIADPNNPVTTIGGNEMIPDVPDGSKKSQGSLNVANPLYAPYTLNRPDVIQFETSAFTDTMTVIGFPKATIYAKGKTTKFNTPKTDFDIMVRIIDVYPNGREMFITEGVVNAKARDYAKSIFKKDTNNNLTYSNIYNNTFYPFQFDLLPMGHTFGVGHKIKILISSSNFPKYQSNPHIPIEDGEFFRWKPGDYSTYNYYGTIMSAQNCEITLEINQNFPSYVEFPKVLQLPQKITPTESPKNNFRIYPNPAKDLIFIDFSNYVSDLKANIEIFNAEGKLMHKQSLNGKNSIIDISLFSKGVYFVKLINEIDTDINSFVKE